MPLVILILGILLISQINHFTDSVRWFVKAYVKKHGLNGDDFFGL